MIKKLNRRNFCQCHCGFLAKPGNKYIKGHSGGRSRIHQIPIPNHHLCECPCGELVASDKRFIFGHQNTGRIFGVRGPYTEEQRKKRKPMAPFTEEHKQALRKPRRSHTEEEKQKMRGPRGSRGPFTEEHKQKLRKPKSEEHKQKLRVAQNQPETKERRIQSQIKCWQDLIYRENQIIAIGKGCNVKPNRPEILLRNNFIYWWPKIIYSGDYSIIINGKNPDFICEELKKIIEFNGDYWHRNDIPGEREAIFAEVGYDTLILVDEDLKDTEALKAKVDSFMIKENPYSKRVKL